MGAYRIACAMHLVLFGFAQMVSETFVWMLLTEHRAGEEDELPDCFSRQLRGRVQQGCGSDDLACQRERTWQFKPSLIAPAMRCNQRARIQLHVSTFNELARLAQAMYLWCPGNNECLYG